MDLQQRVGQWHRRRFPDAEMFHVALKSAEEMVFDPFAGIGSVGWEALDHRRRFYGIELKGSYYRTACRFLTEREQSMTGRLEFVD